MFLNSGVEVYVNMHLRMGLYMSIHIFMSVCERCMYINGCIGHCTFGIYVFQKYVYFEICILFCYNNFIDIIEI